MKTALHLLIILFFTSTISFAQITFTEDFESYQVGDYLAETSPDWITWDGTTGGATDVLIVDDNAASGNNAIYLASTSTIGGPQDIVLPFGGQYDTGQFEFSMKIFIPESSEGAYFNFQGEEMLAQSWTLDMYFNADNTLTSTVFFFEEIIYEKETWLDIAIKINLTANVWELYLNGDCLGSTTNFNFTTSVASLNLYPRENDQFWIDDISFTYDPILYPEITDINTGLIFASEARGFTGTPVEISSNITNLGTTTITSFDATFTDGMTTINQSFSGLNLASGEIFEFTLDEPYLMAEGATSFELTTTNVNGMGEDANPCNNAKSNNGTTGYTPAAGKNVLLEHGISTWCGSCPIGLAFMESMQNKYPNQINIAAVHKDHTTIPTFSDPMANETHIAGLYPLALLPNTHDNSFSIFNRKASNGFNNEFVFLEEMTIPPIVLLENGATFNAMTNELEISVAATFSEGTSGDNRLNIILTENGVTGTSEEYDQANDFSGSTFDIGGFENLPDPVPADQMVYQHVSRAILGGFEGEMETLPDEIEAGETHIINYTFEVPAEWNVDNLNIISFMIKADNTVENSTQTTVAEAIDNGFQMATGIDNLIANSAVRAFPNPFGDELNVTVDLAESAEMTANLYSSTGALLRSQKVGSGQANHHFTIKTADLPNGVYQLNIVVGAQVVVKKVVLMR